MELKILNISKRRVAFELINNSAYFSPEKYKLFLNGEYVKDIENNVNGLANTIENNDKSIKRLENNQRRTVTSNHLTVIAYANIKGIKPKSYHAPSIGKKATKICREKDLVIGTTVDSRYGLINTYPVEVLDEIFFE